MYAEGIRDSMELKHGWTIEMTSRVGVLRAALEIREAVLPVGNVSFKGEAGPPRSDQIDGTRPNGLNQCISTQVVTDAGSPGRSRGS